MTTLAELRERARAHTISRAGGPVTDAVLSTWVDTAYRTLRMRLIDRDPDRFATSADVTVGSDGVAPAPVGAYRILRVDARPGQTGQWSLPQVSAQNEHEAVTLSFVWRGGSVVIVPLHEAAGTYRIWHVPGHTPLVADDDEIDAECVPFDEVIALSAAIQCRQKAEEDVSGLLVLLRAQEDLMRSAAGDRTIGAPMGPTRRYRPLSRRFA